MSDPTGGPALDCHGMDCCWDCFHGRKTHPPGDDCSCTHEADLAEARALIAELDTEEPA